MLTRSVRRDLRAIRIHALGVVAVLLGMTACAAGPGRAARNRVLSCPLERVATVKNFGSKLMEVRAYRYPFRPSEIPDELGAVNPAETREFVLPDSVLVSVSDPSVEPGGRSAPHTAYTTTAGNTALVTYSCRRFGEGPPRS